MRFDVAEASGALGDLGTFIPLVASLVYVNQLDAGSILFFAGLYNIFTGFVFNQPVPVQPMKAIAAVAIASLVFTNPAEAQQRRAHQPLRDRAAVDLGKAF